MIYFIVFCKNKNNFQENNSRYIDFFYICKKNKNHESY